MMHSTSNVPEAEPSGATTSDITGIVAALQKELVSLRSSQVASNREILYLRHNQDRVIKDVGTEIRGLKRNLRQAHLKIMAIENNQMILRHVAYIYHWMLLGLLTFSSYRTRLDRHERNLRSSAKPPLANTQIRPRRHQLRRQGAFSGDINDISWSDLNDVRGYRPDGPRYQYPASAWIFKEEEAGMEDLSNAEGASNSRKRSHEDDTEEDSDVTEDEDTGSIPFFRTFKPARLSQSDHVVSSKRRKISSGTWAGRKASSAPNLFGLSEVVASVVNCVLSH